MKKITDEASLIMDLFNRFYHERLSNPAYYSPLSAQAYINAYRLFFYSYLQNTLNVHPEKISLENFSKESILGWRRWLLEERKCSRKTVNARVTQLRAFLLYMRENANTDDLRFERIYLESEKINGLRIVKEKFKGFSEAAARAIFSVVNQTSRTGRRDMALMVLLYNTGARISEILNLTLSQIRIDSEIQSVLIKGKGNKHRTIPLLRLTVEHLKAYLKEYHSEPSQEDDILFYSPNSNRKGILSRNAIAKRIRKYGHEAKLLCDEVPDNLHPHMFRHARATHWLDQGINIVQTSSLLGHAQLNTTMTYLDISIEKKAEILKAFSKEIGADVKPKKISKEKINAMDLIFKKRR